MKERLFFLFVFDTNTEVAFQADKIITEVIKKGYKSHNGFVFESENTLQEIKELLNSKRPDALIYILLDITDNCSEDLMAGWLTKSEYVYANELIVLLKKYRSKKIFDRFENYEELTVEEIQEEVDSLLDVVKRGGLDSLSESQKQRLANLSQMVAYK